MVPYAYQSTAINIILVGSAIFAGLTTHVPHTRTDDAMYDICLIRPHLCYACDAA